MTGLQISDDLTLPIDVASDTSAILARKGAGKTYTGAVLFEEDVAAGIPAVALDPMGAFWGLRASADGKSEGLPVTILGGEHGDAPLERASGKLVADLVVDQPSWYVLDLSALDTNAAQDQFATDFAERLYRRKAPTANRSPLHLIIDEADSFAPQRAKGQERMLGAYEAIARRGRIRGIGSTFITQRPAVLNKNVLTQSEVLITLQITSPQDRKAVEEWAKGHADKDEVETYLGALASLKLGQAWVWSPRMDLFRQVQIRERRTFDSSATPKPGEKAIEPTRLAEVDVAQLREAMAETIEKADAADPKKLTARIRELERELATQAAGTPETVREVVEVPVAVVPPEAVLALNSATSSLREFSELLAPVVGALPTLENAVEKLDAALDAVLEAKGLAVPAGGVEAADPPARPRRPSGPPEPKAKAPASDRRQPSSAPPADTDVHLRAGAIRLLRAIAQWPDGCTRAQAATVAGLKKTGGTFSTYLGDLKRAECITVNGDRLQATGYGRDVAGVDEIPTHDPDAVLAHWRQHLRKGAVRMLDAIVSASDGITRAELAEATGIEQTGGTFSTYLGDLKRAGLIDVGDTVRLQDWLTS